MSLRSYARRHQFLIDSAESLAWAVELDPAHWVATNAPVAGINCDRTFLELLDQDGSGRITCRELTVAARWTLAVLSDRSGIDRGSDVLVLSAINSETSVGASILRAAEKILARAGRGAAASLTLQEVRRVKAQAEAMPVSEAGIVLPTAAEKDDIRRFISDVIAVTGGAEHPSGQPGLGAAQLEAFAAAAQAVLDWRQAGRIPNGADKTDIMPLGENTDRAWSALCAVRGKIDQYFAQCEAVALDERFTQRMGWTDDELAGLDFDDPAVIEQVLREAPLAKASAERVLVMDEHVNPYYLEDLAAFRRFVVEPVLAHGDSSLTAAQWQRIKAFFAAHQAWLESKPQTPAVDMDDGKLREYLKPQYAEAVRALVAESAKAALELDNVRLVEKLILYQANLIDLANNFITFPHLYDPARRAMFEMGSLVMDGRRFNFAVRIRDRAEHRALAESSNMYVMYVEVCPPSGEKYEVAVPVTAGSKGNLCVGKRGVFYDVAGLECDARVAEIIENPISLREAMVAPFKRLGRLVTGKIESLTAKAEKKLDATVSLAAPAGPAQAPQPRPATGLAAGGMLMGAGVAVAALGSATAYIAKTIAQFGSMTILLALLSAAALVALPTSIVAFLKLRRRDLSAILEGAGWGINAPMRLTRAQRNYFTQRPKYPSQARVRRRTWLALTLLVIIVALTVGGYLLKTAGSPAEPATTAPSQPAAP